MNTSNILKILIYLLIYWQKNAYSQAGTGLSSYRSPIDLDLTIISSGDYDHAKDVNMHTYTAKTGKIFKSVKEGVTEIWKATNDSEYSSKVEVDVITAENKAVTILLDGNKTKLFRKHGTNKPWNEIDTTKTTPQSVNIKYKYNSYFYTNIENDNVRTFEAKTGFVFNVVNEYINNTRFEIWKTDQATEYSKKVVVEGSNKVTIHTGEGNNAKEKVFNKGSDGNWKEDTSSGARALGSPAPVAAQASVAKPAGTASSSAGPGSSELVLTIPVPAQPSVAKPAGTSASPVAAQPSVAKPAGTSASPVAAQASVAKPAGTSASPVAAQPSVAKPAGTPASLTTISYGLNPFDLKFICVPMWTDAWPEDGDPSSAERRLMIYKDQTWKSAFCDNPSNFKSLIQHFKSQQGTKVASTS